MSAKFQLELGGWGPFRQAEKTWEDNHLRGSDGAKAPTVGPHGKDLKNGLGNAQGEPLGRLVLISFYSNKPCEPSVDRTLDQRLKA